MGLILDSSVLIDAERRRDNVEKLIERIISPPVIKMPRSLRWE